ncbi:MAG TPA: DNA double-strand break repair nuclease NurA [Actinobacteria bacterium]|nr:DNA double-strand break repair nuclease NurA [Actinomycetota bacterium]
MINVDNSIENKLRESVKFIKEVLAETPSLIDFEHSNEGEPLLIDKDIDEGSFESISEKSTSTKKMAAIDGGSTKIVNGHSFYIGAYRYGYVVLNPNGLIKEEIFSPAIEAISTTNATVKFSKLYLEILEKPPEELPGFDAVLDGLRTLKEWSLSEKLLDKLDEGDMILMDGSLRSSKILPPNLIERICKKAAKRKINLIGITKTSALHWGKHSPLIPIIYRIGEQVHPKQNWFLPLSNFKEKPVDMRWFGNIYVAKLSPTSRFIFRIDINRFDPASPKKIMEMLATASSDPVYMGYPYPLAAIHNLVRIDPHEKEDLYYQLQGLALKEGVKMEEWEALFSNFHELLDIN